MPNLNTLLTEIREALELDDVDDGGGVLRPAAGPVRRLGLALEPWPRLGAWAAEQALDAFFLHRPWGWETAGLPMELGVWALHRGFDAALTPGPSALLAETLGMSELELLGERDGRPLGVIGDAAPRSLSEWLERTRTLFGGLEERVSGEMEPIARVALMGAMTDALVREAAARGAGLYLTGQFREPARQAVRDTKISVVAVGHRRGELWGLRALAGIMQERWPALRTVFAPER